jgi:hypothetical protein
MPRHTRTNDDDAHALAHTIEALRIELAGLRDAIDELREEIAWGNRNCKGYNPMLFRFHPAESASVEMPQPALRPSELQRPTIDDLPQGGPRRQVKLW